MHYKTDSGADMLRNSRFRIAMLKGRNCPNREMAESRADETNVLVKAI